MILNWTPGTDPGGAVAGYTVSVSSNEGQNWNVYTPAGGELSNTATGVTVTGLNASSVYLFEVTADNAAGSSYAAGPIGAKTPALAKGVPTLSVSQNTENTGYQAWSSLHLSWTYTGDDQPNYEFQIEDTTLGENFHYFYNIDNDSSGTWGTAYGLNPGDSYVFRMRQDYADDTVSDWSTTSAIEPPVLAAPNLDAQVVEDTDGSRYMVTGWSNMPTGGSLQLQVMGDPYQNSIWMDPLYDDGTFNVTDGSTDPWLPTGDQGYAFNFAVNGSTSHETGSYTYRARGYATDGEPTAWSAPATASFGASPGPTLATTETDTTITASFTGSAPGYGTATGYFLTAYGQQPGVASLNQRTASANFGSSDSSVGPTTGPVSNTLSGLTPGETYHIVLTAAPSDNSAYSFSHIDATTTGAIVPGPNGPGNLTAGWDPAANNGSGGVAISWTDDSVNEAGFQIQRSEDPSFPAGSETTVFNVGADQTSYIDTTAGLDSVYYYQVRAIGDSSGNYDTPYTWYARVNTPGVSISFGDDQTDPAFNPEIWVDNASMNYSTGTIDPPTSVSDPNLVPVTFTVPLGADTVGTATASWSSSIRLYQLSGGVLTQVGTANPYYPEYDLQWNVSTGSPSQTFYAQAVSPSARLADCSFYLSATLELVTDVAVATQLVTTRPTTQPALEIVTNRDESADGDGHRYAMAGQRISAHIAAGPGILFPADNRYVWEIGDDILSYVTTLKVGHPIVPPLGPYILSSKGTGTINWYWITGLPTGKLETISVIGLNDSFSGSTSIPVYVPTADFKSISTQNDPPVGLGPTWNDPKVDSVHYGGSLIDKNGKQIPFSPGEGYNGTIITPNLSDAEGTVAYMQQVSATFTATDINGKNFNASTDGFVLDTDYPAQTAVAHKNTTNTITADDWNDSPNLPVNIAKVSKYEYSFQAIVYLIYKPTGEDSIYITLQASSWRWADTYDVNRVPFTHVWTAFIKSTTVKFDPFTELPYWNGNFKDFSAKMGQLGK